jgi:hypothetical protein
VPSVGQYAKQSVNHPGAEPIPAANVSESLFVM